MFKPLRLFECLEGLGKIIFITFDFSRLVVGKFVVKENLGSLNIGKFWNMYGGLSWDSIISQNAFCVLWTDTKSSNMTSQKFNHC